MADLPISNRYKAYKEGTESLVRWITRTASRYSNASDFLHTLATPGSSAITLSTRDLVAFTKLVVANIAVDIPENILKITRDVVAEREVCANWYQDQKMNGELTASDKTHAYFIGTLHEIYDILHSARASRKQDCSRTARQTPPESIASAFSNSFQHLKVEEPIENPLGTTTGTVEGFTAAVKPTFRLEKQKDDKAFAIWCLLGDFSAVREYIISVWKDYKAGKNSLIAAGAITDAAFALMRYANEDFAEGNGDIANHPTMLAFLEEEMLVSRENEEMKRAPVEDESMNDDTTKDGKTRSTTDRHRLVKVQDQGTSLCREAGQFFEALVKAFRGGAADVESSASFRKDSPLGAFGDTLLKLVPTIQQYAHQLFDRYATDEEREGRIPADEFLSALMRYEINKKSSQVPIWLVVAGHSYMEIHAVLDGKMSCGGKDLCSHLERIRPMVKLAQQNYAVNPPACLSDRRRRHFELCGSEETVAQLDATEQLAQIATSQDWNFPSMKSAAVLSHFLPIYPSIVSYRVHYDMQHQGVQTFNCGIIVLSMAHFYKAGRKYGLIKSAWKDMDFLLANHVAIKLGRPGTQPIVSEPSKRNDPFEMAALFRTALGVPTVDLDRAVRPRLPRVSDLNFREIIYLSDLYNAVDEIQRGARLQNHHDRECINIILRRLSDAESKGKQKGRMPRKYSLVELLKTYEKHLKAGEPVLNFDYIDFYDLCGRSLRQIELLCRQILRSPATPDAWDFVDSLLWTAADVVNKAKPQSPEELYRTLIDTKFGRTTTCMDGIIEKVGSKYTTAALERSSTQAASSPGA
jgi:hypothetical protein